MLKLTCRKRLGFIPKKYLQLWKGCSVYLLIKDTGLNLQQEPELEAILPQLKLVN